jgi:hypothetical protein
MLKFNALQSARRNLLKELSRAADAVCSLLRCRRLWM